MNNNQSGIARVFPATELGAREALCDMISELRTLGLAEDQVGGIEIALAEVVNNIVEHAYCGLNPGDVNVRGWFEKDALNLHVSDHGHALPNEELPAGRPADVSGPIEDLPEGGFGWFMIRTLAREIRYARENGENHLHLTFDLIPPAA